MPLVIKCVECDGGNAPYTNNACPTCNDTGERNLDVYVEAFKTDILPMFGGLITWAYEDPMKLLCTTMGAFGALCRLEGYAKLTDNEVSAVVLHTLASRMM